MKSDLIRKIFLVWRNAIHERRIIVGELTRLPNDKYEFKYIENNLKAAKNKGFTGYPDFPNLNKLYKENVMDVFVQRLNNTERTDIESYFDFWEIDQKYKDDKFYILAQTQGLLSTDNFEFLASYYNKRDLSFISEIAGISSYNVKSNELVINDTLSWKYETDNEYDKKAVIISKGSKKLGYVKLVHNEVFHQSRANKLKIKLKSFDKNGEINRAFIVIYNES